MSPKNIEQSDFVTQEVKQKVRKEEKPIFQETRPVTIMTENDAYIAERMKAQPSNLSEIEVTQREDKLGIHRLSLPDFFEQFSYDCTTGVSCKFHGWSKKKVSYGLDMEMDRWEQSKHGNYIFRWLSKNKRALDQSINIKGWLLVNQRFFNEAPKILFSINGGIENGDSILAFMPVKRALAIREEPSEISRFRVKSEETKHKSNPNFYQAKIDSEQQVGDDYAPADAQQEGRDF